MRDIKFISHDIYKRSSVAFAEYIPSHWSIHRIKDVIHGIDQGWSPNAENREVIENEWGVLKLSAINNGKYNENKHKALPIYEVPKHQYLVKRGDFLLTRSNTPDLVGECCLVTVEPTLKMMYSDLIYNLKINKRNSSDRYLNYFLSCESFRWLKRVSARGLNESMVKISQGIIRGWNVFLPPISEQEDIADYLDNKTEQIDRKIDLLTQKARQYGNLKQSLINETVCRGLDRSVEMKESGIDWIRKMPKHWDLVPIRSLLENRINKNVGNLHSDYLSLVAGIGVIPYAEKGNVGNKKPEDLEKCKLVHPGDLVLNSMNFGIGSFGISRYKGVCSSVYIVMRPQNSDLGEYLYRIFQIKPFQMLVSSYGKGIMDIRMAIKWTDLKNIYVPYPPTQEQKAIACFLDEKTAHIDLIIEAIHTQIYKLKELRKTLINDIVTGKIKVPIEGVTI
ncbi:restriction endonuclease subunit S [Paenibacillus sp. CMAA1739]|uniref:restriction endonuclease subunit S n=1 Tax=Paenibacillus ottowii TaxID=2315729 RepID=UPI00273054E6|nr:MULTISPECIES: restriction endonuclease subunit S [Paenibacillus]MDP1510086.1 restriction endonuclease subunit S [Paenibacillus ottowii]MEC4568053.1 restriction endonuclease subunit S [Paenibacillus sp. CMAA1739]